MSLHDDGHMDSQGAGTPPGRLYVYNIQCRVYFPLGTLPSRGVRSTQYTVYSPGGEYAVYSTLPHWGLYLSWTSAVNTAAAARFLYSVNFSISVGPPRIRMGPDCGAIARFCFVVVHLRLSLHFMLRLAKCMSSPSRQLYDKIWPSTNAHVQFCLSLLSVRQFFSSSISVIVRQRPAWRRNVECYIWSVW